MKLKTKTRSVVMVALALTLSIATLCECGKLHNWSLNSHPYGADEGERVAGLPLNPGKLLKHEIDQE